MGSTFKPKLSWLLPALPVFFLLNLSSGSIDIPFSEILLSLTGQSGEYTDIIWTFRMPKAITCVLAGSALSVAGLMMQTLFRNPLAGPDVLGLTSGASLFVALILMAGKTLAAGMFSGPWMVALGSSTGAALVFILVLAISRFVSDNTSLLIIGLMIGAATASVVGVLQYISVADDLQAFMIWGLGSVGGTGWDELPVLAFVTAVGFLLAFISMKSLNGLLLGAEYAQSLGISLSRSRLIILSATCLLTGGVTAFCGPVAFVGLAVPHLVRLLHPPAHHGVMIPAVMAGGAILLLICDIIAQMPGSVQILPLNAVTALIGAPVVIWLIVRNKKISV